MKKEKVLYGAIILAGLAAIILLICSLWELIPIIVLGIGYLIYKCVENRSKELSEQEVSRQNQVQFMLADLTGYFLRAVDELLSVYPVFCPVRLEEICIQPVFIDGVRQYQVCVPHKPDVQYDIEIVKALFLQKIDALYRANNAIYGYAELPITILSIYERKTYWDIFVLDKRDTGAMSLLRGKLKNFLDDSPANHND